MVRHGGAPKRVSVHRRETAHDVSKSKLERNQKLPDVVPTHVSEATLDYKTGKPLGPCDTT